MPDESNVPPVRWGVIGCGNIARHAVCPAIREASGAVLTAVSSRSREKAEQLAGELGAARSHGSYEALLDDPEVEAVYIGLPNGLHEEWTVRAAQAGKHVLCEKSLALDSEAAARMRDAASSAGVRLMEAYMYRHHPQWNVARALIAEGRIGDVRMIRAGLLGDLRGRPEDHRWSTEIGGGALFDVTCYAVNAARYLYGTEPVAVQATGVPWEDGGVDATTAALLDFGGGRLALAAGSLITAGEQYCEITGEKGLLRLARPFIPALEPPPVRLHTADGEQSIETPGANHYAKMVEHFSRCVRDTGTALSPGEDGTAQMLSLDAVRRAWHSESRTPVRGDA